MEGEENRREEYRRREERGRKMGWREEEDKLICTGIGSCSYGNLMKSLRIVVVEVAGSHYLIASFG